MVKYATIAEVHAFVAVALETSGTLSKEGLEFISEFESQTTDTTQVPEEFGDCSTRKRHLPLGCCTTYLKWIRRKTTPKVIINNNN